jgi:hypothetical protein
MQDKITLVRRLGQILFLGAIVLGGCQTAHDVAVTSFHVLDAPANYVRRHIDHPATTTTATTTVASDSVTPGHHVVPTQDSQHRQTTTTSQPHPSASPRASQNNTSEKPKSSPSAPRSVTNQPTQDPTAKVVPGKPGYVFSPFDPNGGYVDVTGYASGSKVKDPYSGKVFLVP